MSALTETESARPRWRTGLTRNVVILGFVSLLNDGASEMIYPLLPVFLTAVLGAGPAALGIIEGIAESTASFLKLASGYLSDRVKRRKGWIVAGYSISNMIRPLIAVAVSWPQVLALRFSDRVGKGLRTSPRDAIIADSTPPEFRGMAYGFHRAMDHGGAIIGPLFATGLLLVLHGTPQENLKTVFLLSFIPGFVLFLILVWWISRAFVLRPLAGNGHPGFIAARRGSLADLQHQVVRQHGQGLGHQLVDQLAV